MYAQGSGEMGDRARQVLADGSVISVQALNEFPNVLRRKFRLDWKSVAAAVADVRELFESIQPLDIETHDAANALAEAHGFSLYDSLIVASAFQAGCETLLTDDLQAGRRIGSLAVVNPFSPKP